MTSSSRADRRTSAIEDLAIPDRQKLLELLGRLRSADGDVVLSPDDVDEVVEAIGFTLASVDPEVDYNSVVSRNPMHKVFFRAGLLACREHLGQMVDGYAVGGPIEIARVIRATWWPVLGPDPGPPRLFQFDEVAEEVTAPDGSVAIKARDLGPSVEALPRAFKFLQGITRG